MFQLSIIKDTVPIHPSDFGVPAEQAIIAELNKKYSNRVVHDLGLCISVFDLSHVGEGKVRYGDGFLWYSVTFRLVVFRPFVSEVLLAKVKSSDEDISLGFFDDIYIPSQYLPQPSTFDPSERAFFWIPTYEADEETQRRGEQPSAHTLLDTPTSERMYIDSGEIIRIRVEADDFFDFEPGPPGQTGEGDSAAGVGAGGAGIAGTTMKNKRAPYTILCSIAEQGLGPVAWWAGEEGEQDQDADGEAMQN